MAVSTTFKQQCPTCDAVISIKESMAGKKVECTKCKDKFVAEKPDDEAVAKPNGKKDTKVGSKKTTSAISTKTPPPGKKSSAAVSSKAAPAGKRGKLEVDDDDDDAEEPVKATNGKTRTGANGKAKKADDDHDDESDGDDDAGETKKKDKKKLTIGLALAGVGVVILIVAAVFVLRGGGGSGRNNPPPNQGGGDFAQKPDPDKKGFSFDENKPPVAAAAVPFTDAERVKLSNLLPGDTERVFHACLKDLFDANSPLRAAVFETPGALDDADLKKKLGFSILGIDDMLCADKVTGPSWKFTVIRFKDLIKEDELKGSLQLKAVGKGIDGQIYYKMAGPHPWFDQLSRFSFGVPSNPAAVESPSDKPTYFRIHNPQTLIIADEAPMLAFLKVKGQFPQLSTPAPAPNNAPPVVGPGVTPMPIPGGMMGGNPLTPPMPMPPGPMPPGPMPTGPMPRGAMPPGPMPPGPMPPGPMPPGPMPPGPMPPGPIPPPMMLKPPGSAGNVTQQPDYTRFAQAGVQPLPPPRDMTPQPKDVPPMPKDPNSKDPLLPKDPSAKDPAPAPANPAADTYMTIRPTLKAILDRMEARGADGKDKVLLSSATDMDASILPEVKNKVMRKPRQFWDVTLLLEESKPGIRYLGTALVQRDTLKYRLRNEITCGEEEVARDVVARQLNQRVAKSVARFIQLVVGHDVRVTNGPAAPPAAPPSAPPPPGAMPPPEKSTEPLTSQITVTQQFTTVDFVLDLLLDNAALMQARSIATAKASALTGDMMAAAGASLRHQLAAAGKSAGDKGLSQRQVTIPPGRLPPGSFPRLETTPPSLRIEREPKNRISFLAGLLPYMGHQTLLEKIKFDQSWRDPGNWVAGSTIVPQFLDPTYPPQSRQVAFGDLPVDFAATHYVGIAGVGLDAASYKRGDPATVHKRGAFSYDESASIEEIVAGRGVSNTILMAQVPHDAITGVSPWIAGGGATLRGVPEKNSIAPFVSTKNGEKRGTFVMMADGSVRFIDQNVSDDVFKAMCTIAGPAPADFDLKRDPNTPLIPAPADKSAKEPDKKAPVKADPPKTAPDRIPEKGDGQKKPEPDNKVAGVKAALQGVWNAKSMEKDGRPAPAEVLKKTRFTFKGDSMVIPGNQDDKEETVAYVIDPSKSPMHLDFTPSGAPFPVRCIFTVTKDELMICFRPPDPKGLRPTAFVAPAESGHGLIVLTRQQQ